MIKIIKKKKDSIPPKIERYGIRFGADISKLARSFYDKNYKGLELVGDYRLTKRHYIAVELGNENNIIQKAKKLLDDMEIEKTKLDMGYRVFYNRMDDLNLIDHTP